MAADLYSAEEARLPLAVEQMSDVARRYNDAVIELGKLLAENSDPSTTERLVQQCGLRLWERACDDVQGGYLDDRPLYWARLGMRRLLRELGLAEYISALEWWSRGFADPEQERGSCACVITGFDPFRFDRNITQSNPSGCIALHLAGNSLADTKVRSAIFPVRFADFNDSLVERVCGSWLTDDGIGLIVSSSMGRDRFDHERFPGRRRSAGPQTDNAMQLGGGDQEEPLPSCEGAEFVESSLPITQAILAERQWRWPVIDNREIRTLPRGKIQATSLDELADQTAVTGSGGGYLSNEISYRMLNLRDRRQLATAVGHIHVPRVDGFDAHIERSILDQFTNLLNLLWTNVAADRRAN